MCLSTEEKKKERYTNDAHFLMTCYRTSSKPGEFANQWKQIACLLCAEFPSVLSMERAPLRIRKDIKQQSLSILNQSQCFGAKGNLLPHPVASGKMWKSSIKQMWTSNSRGRGQRDQESRKEIQSGFECDIFMATLEIFPMHNFDNFVYDDKANKNGGS